MSEQIYKTLREHLDTMPVGFPRTDTGVELKILEHLFSTGEARLALCMDYRFESPEAINRKFQEDLEFVKEGLEGMASKGSIYSKKVHEEYHYALSPYVVGIYEMQIGRLELDNLRDTKQFFNKGFGKEYLSTAVPQMRVIPVEKSVTAENQVATYDEIRAIIENADGKIGVMDCLCKKGRDMGGYPCKATTKRELCLSFGDYHHMLSRFGWCRDISREEALEILEAAEKDGLVLQPSNEQVPRLVCACCACCCGILLIIKAMPRPVDCVASNYHAVIDNDRCIGCGTCVVRCQMDAIAVDNGKKAHIDLDRCIGCGLCISTCEQEAAKLFKKEKKTIPPKDMDELYQMIMKKKKQR
jgi:H+/Na+-translocating ferredoxin:NAD+ oxidoreductase subunit B